MPGEPSKVKEDMPPPKNPRAQRNSRDKAKPATKGQAKLQPLQASPARKRSRSTSKSEKSIQSLPDISTSVIAIPEGIAKMDEQTKSDVMFKALGEILTKVQTLEPTFTIISNNFEAVNTKLDELNEDTQAHTKAINENRDELLSLNERVDELEANEGDANARLDKLENHAQQTNAALLDLVKNRRIEDVNRHAAHFVLAIPEFNLYGKSEDWIKSAVQLICQADNSIAPDGFTQKFLSANFLNRKLLRKVRTSQTPVTIDKPLQILFEMIDKPTMLTTVKTLRSHFIKDKSQFRAYSVNYYIPPTLQGEHAQIRRQMEEAKSRYKSAHYFIDTVYNDRVGYSFRVKFTPDRVTKEMTEIRLDWHRPYPNLDFDLPSAGP